MGVEAYGCKTGITPSGGGWWVNQLMRDGTEQRIPPSGAADNDRVLVSSVRLFRAQNHIDIGDVEHDIAKAIRVRSPQNDTYPGKVFPRKHKTDHEPLISRIRDWLLVLAPKHPRLLTQDEAKGRARICSRCPQNVRFETACLPCVEEIQSRGQNLRRIASYVYADALKACRLHGVYLPTAVFVDRGALPETNNAAPNECWMRSEPM